MFNSEKQEFRVKRIANFRDIAVTVTNYFMIFATIVAVEEVPPSFLNCAIYIREDDDFILIFSCCMHKKATIECLYPVKFDQDLIPSIYVVGFYAILKDSTL